MMTPEVVLDIYGGALWLIVKFVVIIVTPSLAVGLIASTFKAATQINAIADANLVIFPI